MSSNSHCLHLFTLVYIDKINQPLLMHFAPPSIPRDDCALPARRMFQFVLGLLLVLATVCTFAAFDSATLQHQLIARFGPARAALFKDWLQTVNTAKVQAEATKLRQINNFINQNIVFEDDRSVWQQSDYWATPLETIGQGRGDCEDFAIFKYVSLRMAGVPAGKLRLIYVKASLNTPDGPLQVAHMVLAYYATPNAEPQVLDNLEANIRPASKRPDLQPVFSFNSDGIFAGVSGHDKATAGGVGRLSRWEDALRRILAEGYE